MAKSEITGKRKKTANNVSHANNRTLRWQNPNIQKRRIWVPELNRFVLLSLSTRDIRSITKLGLLEYARKNGVKIA